MSSTAADKEPLEKVDIGVNSDKLDERHMIDVSLIDWRTLIRREFTRMGYVY